MRCEARRDPILLWVMGQLENDEERGLREHLQSGCRECAGYLAEARELQLDLLLAPDPAELPSNLERRLLERVSAAHAAQPGSLPSRGASWRWAAAAALVALLAGGLGYRLASSGSAGPTDAAGAEDREELRVALEEADVELGELESRLAALEQLLEESNEQVELLRAPDVQRVELRGTRDQPRASAHMFWQWAAGYYCYLHARGLPRPGGDAVYALWMENETGQQLLVGTFRPDARGEGVVWAKLPADAGRATRAVVTLESAEPGQQPRGPAQLASS